jgi:hypothetical protein
VLCDGTIVRTLLFLGKEHLQTPMTVTGRLGKQQCIAEGLYWVGLTNQVLFTTSVGQRLLDWQSLTLFGPQQLISANQSRQLDHCQGRAAELQPSSTALAMVHNVKRRAHQRRRQHIGRPLPSSSPCWRRCQYEALGSPRQRPSQRW